MCYEFETWHWKARAKEMHKAQSRSSAAAPKDEPVKPAQQTEHKRSDVKPSEKTPA